MSKGNWWGMYFDKYGCWRNSPPSLDGMEYPWAGPAQEADALSSESSQDIEDAVLGCLKRLRIDMNIVEDAGELMIVTRLLYEKGESSLELTRREMTFVRMASSERKQIEVIPLNKESM